MTSLERCVEYSEYLVELARKNPAALQPAPTSSVSTGRKSIHQKLLELYIEETGRQDDDESLLCNTLLLPKLVQRDKLNCLILNLYPGNEGYSLMLKSKSGAETETVKLPYEVTELLEYIDDSQLPPFLVDILEKAQVNVFYSGCVIVEVRDYRQSATGSYDTQYVLLKPTPQSLMCDINNMTNDGNVWTQEDIFQLESKLLLATEEPLCLDPSPTVVLVANRLQYDRKKFNTPMLKRSVKKFTQAAVNRKRKFAQCAAPAELKLHDFIVKKKDKKSAAAVNLKLGKTAVDSWKQRQVNLTAPELVEVEKFAKALEKPEPNTLRDNSLMLIEEHTLERDVTQEKKLLAKLSIYNRPGDDAHLGELYLDHDFVESKSQGATCKFMLGNTDGVKKYLNQFREIFTEEGRRAVKITTQRPGQAPIVTCTQTTPPAARHDQPSSSVATSKQVPTATITSQAGDTASTTSQSAPTVGQKRTMPIQLSLSLAPGTLGTNQNLITPPSQNTQGSTTSQLQFNIQQPNQSQIVSQRHQQGGSQSQSASQRLKQLGIHTSIGSRNNTPTASPVTTQPPAAQLFGSPPPQQNNPPVLQQQTSVTRTPTNTPTPTPPPQILSPPVIPVVTAARKTTSLQESSTVHHLAQTPHHANVATYIQGQGQGESSQATSVTHPQTGMANINIANITGIPPNINIQNLTGLPGMNIANLQGLQNMQVSLSVQGGSIAVPVPISMISTNPLVQNQQGVIVSGSTVSVTGAPSSKISSASTATSLVTMVTALPSATISSTQASSTTQVVTGVLSNTSTVINAQPGMLSLPIGLSGNITQLVPAGMKSHGQLRGSSSMPVFQGIQLVNFPRAPLKTSATVQPSQAVGQLPAGAKPVTSNTGPVTTAILANPSLGGQPILSQISVNQKPPTGTPTHGATLLQLPNFQAQIQSFQKQGQQPVQFHPLIRQQSVPTQQLQTFGGKPKNKKRTTPTPPKQ